MATLQKIRNRGPLIAIIIGLALLAFILGDMIKSGRTLLNSGKMNVAVINGKAVNINTYQNQVTQTEDYLKAIQGLQSLDEQTTNQIRSSVWDDIIRTYLLYDTYNELGLQISKEETEDMVWGNNIHPLIMQTFRDPNTGQFSKQFVVNVLKNLDKDPQLKNLWLYIEDYIKKERQYTKYMALVSKALIVNKLEATEDNKDRKTLYNIDLVAKTFNQIKDNEISYTDEDLKKYYEDHKFLFVNQTPNIDLEYVSFNVIPSHKDTITIYKRALKIKDELAKSTTEQNIVNARSSSPQQVRFYSPEEIKNEGLDTLLSQQPGFVYGPYLKNGSYNIVKLVDIQDRPDTVSARHILISPQNPKVGTIERAKEIADSLVNLLNNGASFETLVAQYSDDKASIPKGGLYENITEGQMVPEFNDFIFSKPVNEIGTVQTQYGIHIVEVTKRNSIETKRKLAIVTLSITPSQETFDKYYTQAMTFRSKVNDKASLEKLANDQKINISIANDITPGTFTISGLSNPREIVQWAFNEKTETGSISEVYQLDNKYVIAAIVNKNFDKYLSFEKVYEQVKNSVIQQKKVDKIYNDYFANAGTITDLNTFAQKIKSVKTSVPNVSFAAFQVANIGYDPKFLAALTIANKDQISGPVKGENGVYVFKVTNITDAPKITDIETVRKNMTSALRNRASYQAIVALKSAAEIKDLRTKFF